MNLQAALVRAITSLPWLKSPSGGSDLTGSAPEREREHFDWEERRNVAAFVDDEAAQNQITFATCVKILSGDLAKLPIILYRSGAGDVRERASNDDRYWLMKQSPNDETSRVHWIQAMVACVLIYGNAYAYVEKTNYGMPRALWPIPPTEIKPVRKNKKLFYTWAPLGEDPQTFPADRIIHFKAYTLDGIVGISPIGQLRLILGQQIRADEYAAKFFTNGALLSGVVHMDGELSDEGADRLRQSFRKFYAGVRNAFGILPLEAGTKYEPMTIPQKDAQFIESNRFRAEQLSAHMGVPLYRLNDLTKMTYTKLEENSLSYKQDTLLFWTEMITGELDRKLIGPKQDLYFEFNFDQYLQADRVATEDANTKALQRGITINEMRKRDNLPPVEGGDTPLVPVNMQPLDRAINPPEPPAAVPPQLPTNGQASRRHYRSTARARQSVAVRFRVQESAVGAIEDAISRVVRKEVRDVRQLLARLGLENTWRSLVDGYYTDEQRKRVIADIAAVFASTSKAVRLEIEAELEKALDDEGFRRFVDEYAEIYALRHGTSSRAQLLGLGDEAETEEELRARVIGRLDEWEATRAGKEAANESVRLTNAAARALYTLAGIEILRWVANPNACPICQELNGRSAGIDSPFLGANAEINPNDGETAPLRTSTAINHPPLHGGCTCTIEPGG